MNSLNHLIVLFKVYISFTHHHLKLIMHAITQLRMRYARVTHAITQLRMCYARVTQAVPRAPTKLNRALGQYIPRCAKH